MGITLLRISTSALQINPHQCVLAANILLILHKWQHTEHANMMSTIHMPVHNTHHKYDYISFIQHQGHWADMFISPT